MMKLIVDIPHEELPTPELEVRVELTDDGKRLAITTSGSMVKDGRLGDFADGGYFMSARGGIFDADRGSLLALRMLARAVECDVSDGWSKIGASGKYLEFATALLGGCSEVTLSLGGKASERLEAIREEHDAPVNLTLFAGELYEHQMEAVKWMRSRCLGGKGFGLVADEMGLGKTVEACAFIADMHAREPYLVTLIVCPASVIRSWVSHLARHVPSLDVAIVEGTQKRRAEIIKECGHDVLVTSIGCARRDSHAHSSFCYGLLIIDEATAIRGHTSKSRTAIRRIRADRKFILSGTPAPNTVEEIHSVFSCMDAEYLGTRKRFRKAFAVPIEMHGDSTAAEALRALIEPCMLRRLKDVLDMPEKNESEIAVELYPEQREAYVELERETRLRLQAMTDDEYEEARMGVIGTITHLRQITVSPAAVLPDYQGRAVKVDTAVTLATKHVECGDKVLVYTLFVRDVVDRLANSLLVAGLAVEKITGDTPIEERDAVIDRFSEAEDAGVLIISDAGGTGLNLQAANVEIQLTGWFNFDRTDQAADRIHRIGQGKPVTIYRLVAQDTIEERMQAIRESKWATSSSVLRQHDRALLKMSRSELIDLLGGSASKPTTTKKG